MWSFPGTHLSVSLSLSLYLFLIVSLSETWRLQPRRNPEDQRNKSDANLVLILCPMLSLPARIQLKLWHRVKETDGEREGKRNGMEWGAQSMPICQASALVDGILYSRGRNREKARTMVNEDRGWRHFLHALNPSYALYILISVLFKILADFSPSDICDFSPNLRSLSRRIEI